MIWYSFSYLFFFLSFARNLMLEKVIVVFSSSIHYFKIWIFHFPILLLLYIFYFKSKFLRNCCKFILHFVVMFAFSFCAIMQYFSFNLYYTYSHNLYPHVIYAPQTFEREFCPKTMSYPVLLKENIG